MYIAMLFPCHPDATDEILWSLGRFETIEQALIEARNEADNPYWMQDEDTLHVAVALEGDEVDCFEEFVHIELYVPPDHKAFRAAWPSWADEMRMQCRMGGDY